MKKLRSQIESLEQQLLHGPGFEVKQSALAKARMTSLVLEYLTALAQPLPVPPGAPATTLVCPHCTKTIKLSASK
ncbi:MAG: hypothetical protein JO328_12200 [Hyphomicrobiales bacterium]|nr:hypothetical protein [Hyphomicrobiales bacterium]